MREGRLICLGLFEIPLFVALLFLILSLKTSKMSFRFYKEIESVHPRKIQQFLENPFNFQSWMDVSHPRIKSIRPRTDAIGRYTQITFGDANYEMSFKMKYQAVKSYRINGGEEIYQVKYTLRSEFLDLTFDHVMNEMGFVEGGSMFTTKISAEMTGSILGLSFFLGRFSLQGVLEEAFEKLVKELVETSMVIHIDDVVKSETLNY